MARFKTFKISQSILRTRLDIVVLSEHDCNLRAGEKPFKRSLKVIESLKEMEVKRKVSKPKEILLGMEYSARFRGEKYHLGCIFHPAHYNLQQLPPLPEERMSVPDFVENYLRPMEAIAILNHPASGNVNRPLRPQVTQELIESGLVQGVEGVNGMLLNLKGENQSGLVTIQRGMRHLIEAENPTGNAACVAGSDDHTSEVVGDVATLVPEGMDLFTAIREAVTKAVILPTTESQRQKAHALLRDLSLKQSNSYIMVG